jgi:hypothetical protein
LFVVMMLKLAQTEKQFNFNFSTLSKKYLL